MRAINFSSKKTSNEVYLDPHQLAKRWGNCHPKTAKRRAKKLGARPFRPNERTVLYPLSELERVEGASKHGKGFQKLCAANHYNRKLKAT
jgi:hypothetical protein